jgi:oligoendopeptidase F
MAAYFKALGGYSRTFGTTMNGEAQKVRSSPRRASIRPRSRWRSTAPNIPVSVYSRLVDGVNKNLPAFHRYLKLRKQILASTAALLRPLRAAGRLGEAGIHAGGGAEAGARRGGAARPEYQATIQRAFKERWIDLLPNEGKRSGAYSTAAPTTSTRTC